MTWGTVTIPYEVRFLPTRRTLAIEVHPDGQVLVRAPLDCPHELIAERVKKRANWINRQRTEFERYHPRTPARQYIAGESHLYLGRQYRLKLIMGNTASVKPTRGHLLVTLPKEPTPERIKAAVRRWYRDRAHIVFDDVLTTSLCHFTDIPSPHMIVRTMHHRWGSLSPRGTMTLNVDLVRAPRPCIEYVITHELSHIQHPNHGPQFFKLLERVMPDWKHRKHRLETALA